MRNQYHNRYNGYALTLSEVAKILKISTKLASRIIRNGELNAIKIGREYRVSGKSLDDYINGKKTYVVNVTSNPQDWILETNCGIVCTDKKGKEVQ